MFSCPAFGFPNFRNRGRQLRRKLLFLKPLGFEALCKAKGHSDVEVEVVRRRAEVQSLRRLQSQQDFLVIVRLEGRIFVKAEITSCLWPERLLPGEKH